MVKKRFKEYTVLFLISIFFFSVDCVLSPKLIKSGEYSHDNYVWISANLNMTETHFKDICFVDPWDALLVVSEENVIYSKNSYDTSWHIVEYSKEYAVKSIILDPFGRIILQADQQLWIKDALSSDWINVALPPFVEEENEPILLSFKPADKIFLASGTHLYLYTENAWKTLSNKNHLEILSMIYHQESNELIVGVSENGIWRIDLKTDSQNKMSIQPENVSISLLFHSVNEDNACFAFTGEGILYRTLDRGNHWGKASLVSENNVIHDFCEEEARLGVFFAFTRLGLYITTNYGLKWSPLQNLIENIEVSNGCYCPYEQRYYIATKGAGIRVSETVPSQPAPTSPKNGENVYLFKPFLTWELFGGNSLPASYHVMLSNTADFTEILYDQENIMGDSILVPEGILRFHNPYYWKIRVETMYWNSDWTETFHFTLRQRWIFTPGQKTFQWNERKFIFHDTEAIWPYMEQGRLYLPVRAWMEILGAKVDWDSAKEQITIYFKEKVMLLDLKSNENTIQIKNSRSYLPLRDFAAFYDWNVEWDDQNHHAVLKENKGQ